jgi:pyruvate/2-oxoglutarate dehydrogenase complex dihydrolipoamide dehydrogenase (E3) component
MIQRLVDVGDQVQPGQGLNLDAAGVKTGSRGRIVVDEHFRTSAAGIFAS